MKSAPRSARIRRSRRRTSDASGRSGALLVCVLVCLGIATSIVLVSVRSSLQVRRQMTRELQLEQTRWLLEAGSIRGVTELRNRPDYRGETWTVTPAFNETTVATVEITVSDDAAAGQVRMNVTARIQEIGLASQPTQRSDSWLVDLPKSESADENTNR